MSNIPTELAITPVSADPSPDHPAGYSSGSGNDGLRGTAKGGASSDVTPHILWTIHQHLRGRYPLAIVLGLVLSVGFGYAVWKFQRPIYHSEGLVRIANSLPPVMQQTDQNSPMAMFDSLMLAQRTLISSRRVADSAILDPIWKTTGRQIPTDPERYFASNLRVDIKPRSEFIEIAVTDPDPGTAAAAVTSIINAYAEMYNSQEKQLEQQRIGLLAEREKSIQARIRQLNQLLSAGSKEYGSTRLDWFYEGAASRLARVEDALAEVTTAMATATPERPGVKHGPANATNPSETLTVDQIAVDDPAMRGYVDEQLRAEREMARLNTLGIGSSHILMVMAKQASDEAKTHVTRYAEMYREFHAVTAQNLGDPGGRTSTAGKSVETLRADETRLTKIRSQVKQEMVEIGTKRADLDRNTEELDALKKELDQVAKRIDSLQAENGMGGRLSIINPGEIPLSPDKDRRMLLTAGSGAFGAFLPAGLLLLVSFVRRRYRFAADTEADALSKHIPLLGILPELSSLKPNADHMMTAANGVHQIRMSLQTQSPKEGCSVYLVTSATSGEGKTSLTMAIGLSFTAARLRTLLIDADLVGRSLTNTTEVTGEEGLHEAVKEGIVNGRIRKLDFGPYILAAGKANASDACTLPTKTLRTLLNEVRQNFDVIIIDSGPILGSLEAAIFAPLVDGVIVAISRGQEQHLLARAMLRLNALRANVAGCIFNRAKQYDYEHSQYASTSNYRSTGASPPFPSTDVTQRTSRFGPLVQSVAATMPADFN